MTGPPLGLDEDDFSLFETQCSTPVVNDIASEPTGKGRTKSQRILGRLRSSPPRKKPKNDEPVSVEDDDDSDFASDVIWKRKGRGAPKERETCSAGSSGDFVTQKPKAPQQENVVAPRKKAAAEKKKEVQQEKAAAEKQKELQQGKAVADKQKAVQQGKVVAASKKSTRVAKPKVPKLVPYKFPLVSQAKQIKDLVLSKEFIRDHGRFVNNFVLLLSIFFTKNMCIFQS